MIVYSADEECPDAETEAGSPEEAEGEEAVVGGPEDAEELGAETIVARPAGAEGPGDGAADEFSEDRTVAKRPEDAESLGDETMALPKSAVDEFRVSKIVVESGLVSESEAATCMRALEQVRSVGVNRTLLDVMLDRGVLTSNQAMAVRAAAEAGDEAGLLGGYQLLEKIGEGGMGEVYKAKQISLDRLVAIKVLPERLAHNREFLSRFEREAKIAAKLDHQNVVRAIDVGVAAGKHYFAMEYVEGRTVGDVLDEKGAMPEGEALKIMIQVTRALESAWSNNLIHRDVKPDNILLTPDNVAKLADLGLARELVASEDTRITQTGAVMGTPQYVSPEQATGSDVDIRTDIYSLGATFYHMVIGRPPFEGRNVMEVISARFQGRYTPVKQANPEVSLEVAGVIARMMARNVENRYPDPRVLLHDLLLVDSGQRPQFASASESARMRAIEAAKTLKTDAAFYYVRARRTGLRIAFGVMAVVAVAAVAMTAVSLLRRDRGETGPALPAVVEPSLPPAPSAEEVQAACSDVRGLIDGGEFEQAIGLAAKYAAKLARGPGVEELEGLKSEASRKLDERRRREAEEKQRQKRYDSFLAEAKNAIASGDPSTALRLLADARAVKATAEVEKLADWARRMQFVARGEDAERKGELGRAIALYNRALAVEEEPDLRARVEELERRMLLDELTAKADGLRAAGRWTEARSGYEHALEVAVGDEKEPLRARLAECDRELAFVTILLGGEAAAAAEEWQEAFDAADKALSMRPEDDLARDLKARARKALGPEKLITNSVGMVLVLVPEGEFTMGAREGPEDERPGHKVFVSSFYVSKTEVTNAQYALFNPSHREKWEKVSAGDDMPVVCVTWEEANAFCRWLSRKEGARYRLPTEAEWEKAARGTDARVFPWGDSPPDDAGYRCNYAPGPKAKASRSRDGFELVSPVGSFLSGASACGAMDMAGNVWEWCLDWYAKDYYVHSPERDPRGMETGEVRVLRGGSFTNSARVLRASNRRAAALGFFEGNVGFRVAREIESE